MSLEGTLPPVYNAVYEISALQTVKKFFDRFKPNDPNADYILSKYGQRLIGEMTPKILKQDPIWNDPLAFDDLSFEMQHALLDPDFQNVVREAEPDFEFDVRNPTVGLAFRVPIIQHIALMDRIHQAKQQDFAASVDKLNCKKTYALVKSDIARVCPNFVPHLPESPYHFELRINPKKMRKEIASTWRKADQYQPTLENENSSEDKTNDGSAGIFGIRDGSRLLITPWIQGSMTLEHWNNAVNQVCAYAMTTSRFGFQLHQVPKDHLIKTLEHVDNPYEFPVCNLHGLQDYEIKLKSQKASIITRFSSEIQIAPLNEKNEHYYDLTVAVRYHKRQHQSLGINSGMDIAHQALTDDMWKKGLPELYNVVLQEQQKDPEKRYKNPVTSIIDNFLRSKPSDVKSTKGRGYTSKKIVNLSHSNNIPELIQDPMAHEVIDMMIQPYPDRPRLALIH